MMNEEQPVDQKELAASIAKKLNLEFQDLFLIKPMDPIKVKKEFTKLPEKTPTTDKDGVSAIDVTDEDVTSTEIKEVDSDIRKGIIICVPYSYKQAGKTEHTVLLPGIHQGSTILYRDRAGISFDLLKDSKLLRIYEILAVYND